MFLPVPEQGLRAAEGSLPHALEHQVDAHHELHMAHVEVSNTAARPLLTKV